MDDTGQPTADPTDVKGLLPIAGAKGYGLMMMVDIFGRFTVRTAFSGNMYLLCMPISLKKTPRTEMFLVSDPQTLYGSSAFKEQMDPNGK